ncbi:hypothetical protein ACFX12_042588 [Malus domestica]
MLTRLLSAVLRLHHRRFGLSVFEVPSLSLRLHKFFATRLQAKAVLSTHTEIQRCTQTCLPPPPPPALRGSTQP